MTPKVTTADPLPLAEEAGRLLREVWAPPCTHYAPDYLAWQFGFPGPARPLAAAARAGADLVGFAAATPRRACLGQDRRWVYLLSFVAVQAAWRGHGLAARLYAALLGAVREAGAAVVTYAFPDSGGQRSLVRAYDAAGFVRRPLGAYTVHGFPLRPEPAASPWEVTEGDPAALLQAAAACEAPGVLWWAPDPEQLAHYARDPRGRALLVARGPDGAPAAAALAVRSEVATPHGVESVPVVDALFLPRPDPGVLRALCNRAGRCLPGPAGAAMVLVTNARPLAPDLLRSAGLRRLPQHVEGYLCAADESHPFLQAAETNLEVL